MLFTCFDCLSFSSLFNGFLLLFLLFMSTGKNDRPEVNQKKKKKKKKKLTKKKIKAASWLLDAFTSQMHPFRSVLIS